MKCKTKRSLLVRLIIALAYFILIIESLYALGSKEQHNVKAGDSKKPLVLVTIQPQLYFVSRIAQGEVNIESLVAEGQSPHSYEPSPAQLAAIAPSKLWLRIGVESENGIAPKIASLYPSMKIADSTRYVTKNNIDDAHDEDKHVWLGLKAVKQMALAITEELSLLLPKSEPVFRRNLAAFEHEVDVLHKDLEKALGPYRGKNIFVYHSAFEYLLDEFGIKQIAVETGGKEPGPKALSELIEKAKATGAKVVFVQKQFPANAAKTLASGIGGTVVQVDVLSPDWENNLRNIVEAFKAGIK